MPASIVGNLVRAERGMRVMVTDAHVLVWCAHDPLVSAADLLDRAEAQLHVLEARWSRFLEDSDVSRINDSPGAMVPVHPDTIDVLELASDARTLSEGLFDIRVLSALEAAGYDRSFEQLPRDTDLRGGVLHHAAHPRTLGGGVHVDRVGVAAGVDVGTRIDLGGIGKGRAVDAVVGALAQAGAVGACVNIGGDLRVIGRHDDEGFFVGIEDPWVDGRITTVMALDNAAVATSSCTRRTWQVAGETRHHLIDPRSGRPASTGVAAVTVVAGSATWAEICAKTALLLGPDEGTRFIDDMGIAALLTTDDGLHVRAGGFEDHEQ